MNVVVFFRADSYFSGAKILECSKAGTLVQVVDAQDDPHNIGAVLLRTSSDQAPFVNLENGKLWGNAIENYKFLILPSQARLMINR